MAAPSARAAILVLGVLAGSAPLHAERKVAPTLYECAADAPDHAIDHDGVQDACAKRVTPECPGGRTLHADLAGMADRCVVPAGPPPARRRRAPATVPAAAAPLAPTCPPDLPLVTRAGGDVCERTEPPVCPKDFVVDVRSGEDRCVYAPRKKTR